MQKNPYVDQPMSLTGQLSMAVHDWEVHLACIISIECLTVCLIGVCSCLLSFCVNMSICP